MYRRIWLFLFLAAAVGLQAPAWAQPAYINSHGNRVELTPAPDRIAVYPASGGQVEKALALRPELSIDFSVVRYPSGLWEIPLAPSHRGMGHQVARALVEAGLVARVGAVFSAPGSHRTFLLDRGVLVKLSEPAAELPKELLAPTGLVPTGKLGHIGTTFLCLAVDAQRALDGAQAAAALPEVVWALPDFIVPLDLYYRPDDTYYSRQWYHNQLSGAHLHTEEAWDITTGDPQVVVAVIDTGLDQAHPDFDPARLVTGYNATNNTNDPTPLAGSLDAHGTCCSGSIAASMNNSQGISGVCPECSLMGIKMMDGFSTSAQLSVGYRAIQYAADHGAWVLSNSWGIDQTQIPSIDIQPYYDAVLGAANNGRGGAGALVLFASGNGDMFGRAQAIGPDELQNLPQVMAVGGTDYTDTWVAYSDYGPNLSVVAPTGPIDISKPQILTTDTIGNRGFSRNGTHWMPGLFGGEYNTGDPEPDATGNYTQYFNGTSAACPIAAGAAALAWSANPALTPAQVRLVVEQTADKVGGVTYDQNGHHDRYGYGRVNAGRATRAAEIGFDAPGGAACAENFNCTSGLCEKTSPDDWYGSCFGAGPCTGQPDGTACNDGNACTESDACSGGSCAGTALSCDDLNPCTNDSCNPAGGCLYRNNTAACNDGNACTGNDACSGGSCAGTALSCDDLNPCTNDSCNPATGCANTPSAAACDDGNACTANDSCADGTCTGTAVSCDDLNPCTNDSCNPATGCVNTPNTAACDDGNACTGNDSCSGGACAGTAVSCDDLNPCTNDSCNPGSGCVHSPNSSPCDDSNLCTQNDGCSGGSCVGTPLNCSSWDSRCQVGVCNSQTGQCEARPAGDGTACDDGDACTGGDSCQSGVCRGGTDVCEGSGGCSCGVGATGSDLAFTVPLWLLLGLRALGRRKPGDLPRVAK